MNNKVLVVGGAGYIGGSTVDELLAYGWDVTVYDILAYERKYLKPVKFVYGDIRDRDKLKKILPQFDIVIWLAALVGDGACAEDPFLTQSINEDATKWFVDNYGGFIVFMSTCSVYGKNNELIDEAATPNPLSVYAKTKLAAERYILEKAADRSLIFRLGTLYGLGDVFTRIRLDLVVNVLTMRATREQKLKVFGGEQWRPLLHVRDVAAAIESGMSLQYTGLFNLSARNFQIREIAEAIQRVIPCEFEKVDMMFEDQRNYRVSNSKWKNMPYVPQEYIDIEEGIREINTVIAEHRLRDPDSAVYSNEQHIHSVYGRWL
jgi:nucleoside-diphosphate-sugar epimerase